MKTIFFTAIICLSAFGTAQADDTAFFESKVLPVLQNRCYECHSHEKKIKGGLALDLKAGWQTGGDNGPAIVPGDLVKSHPSPSNQPHLARVPDKTPPSA